MCLRHIVPALFENPLGSSVEIHYFNKTVSDIKPPLLRFSVRCRWTDSDVIFIEEKLCLVTRSVLLYTCFSLLSPVPSHGGFLWNWSSTRRPPSQIRHSGTDQQEELQCSVGCCGFHHCLNEDLLWLYYWRHSGASEQTHRNHIAMETLIIGLFHQWEMN